MPVAVTKYIEDKRILRTVKPNGRDNSFLDADIDLMAGFNTGSTPRWIKYNFITVIPKVVYHLNWGDNGYLMKEFFNVSSVTIDMMPGINGNGGVVGDKVHNFFISFFFSNPELIQEVIYTSNSNNNRPLWGKHNVSERLLNLKKLTMSPCDTADIFQGLLKNPVEYMKVSCDNPCFYNNNLAEQMTSLKYIDFTKFKGDNTRLYKFPPNLIYMHITTHQIGVFDIKDYFSNTKRMGLSINGFVNGVDNITYSGGAIFPEHIVEIVGMPVHYIFRLANTNYLISKPTPDMISQFIIDFANQVKSVTLANKRILIQGIQPNTSYTDLSQPLYTTYTDSLNYIVNTLGITVTYPN